MGWVDVSYYTIHHIYFISLLLPLLFVSGSLELTRLIWHFSHHYPSTAWFVRFVFFFTNCPDKEEPLRWVIKEIASLYSFGSEFLHLWKC
jgi:hypothetical protein